jgi:two-component system, OmpR family, sensor histidine kinase BaeS
MLKSLRGRFILSHILPLLVVIPLMGIATIYLIEQKVLIPSLLSEVRGNALALSQIAAREQEIWTNPGYAKHLLTQGSFYESGRLMLLDNHQVLLASSELSDANRIGTKIDLPNVETARQGQVVVQLIYSKTLQDDIADAIAPVRDASGKLLGFVRLSYHRLSIFDQSYQIRYLLIGILTGGLLLGTIIGIALAINVSVPIENVTNTVDALVTGEKNENLPETGAEETRRLARSVNALMERLRTLEAARKRLLANLVHEIGRPLGALRMGLEALSHGADRDRQFYAELLAGMDQEMARLQHLLTDLSHLYEQTLGVLELDRQPLDLVTWLPETLSPWQQSALKKKLHWEIKLPVSIPIVQADPVRLGQVIGNLISNAIKFTPSGGTVRVQAGGDEHQVWIKVSDNGPGIPPDMLEEVFTPFVRGGHGKRFPQGMGLGLSIARELTEAHGGRLEVESEKGWGAIFIIRLPFSPNIKL